MKVASLPLTLPLTLSLISLTCLTGSGEATVAVTIGTLALTAPQVSALALVKVLGLKAGLLLSRTRGRREAESREGLEEEVEAIINLVEDIQMEECMQTLVCALNTKQVSLPSLRGLEKLLVARSHKFSVAKLFGASGKKTEACEAKYKCQMTVKNMAAALELL